jgi:DNA-binding CsgD family transcriptional regulator
VTRAGKVESVTTRAGFDLVEALGSSLDIRVVLERAYPLLLRLVSADYGALGLSSTGDPRDFEWMVSGVPPAFFAAYAEMAPHDFVRTSVAGAPNVVLRDQEMVSRGVLEANPMYHRAREVGVRLEQVMAVMLHIDGRWQSGLSLYRDRRRPFTERDRALLQRVTPALVNAVRNCHVHSGITDRLEMLDAVVSEDEGAHLLVVPPATVIEQTAGAPRLLEKWFAPHDRGSASHLPPPLAARFEAFCRGTPDSDTRGPASWTRRAEDETLTVSFVRLPCRPRWLLALRETHQAISVPAPWAALLTAQQRKVAAGVLRGWDNRLIATDLGCATATVKKHLQFIFDRLGIASRTALVARAAAETRRP